MTLALWVLAVLVLLPMVAPDLPGVQMPELVHYIAQGAHAVGLWALVAMLTRSNWLRLVCLLGVLVDGAVVVCGLAWRPEQSGSALCDSQTGLPLTSLVVVLIGAVAGAAWDVLNKKGDSDG